MELFQASRQWATRPADERFSSLGALFAKTREYANAAREKVVRWADLRVGDSDGDLSLIGKAGVPAKLTHFAFGQLCARVGAPAAYLRGLPATLAAQNVNHGLKAADDGDAKLLFHQNGGLILRAVTSDVYERVWNYEVADRLVDLATQHALIPAQQTFSWADGKQVAASEGADKALYASDHDMFAFLMSTTRDVVDPVGKLLRRGIIVTNSEVGAAGLNILGFYFRDVCCNHIIWGAEHLASVNLRHVGNVRERWMNAAVRVRKYLDGAASIETARFAELTVPIAGTKDAVLDALFGKKILPRVRLEAAYAAVVEDEDGDARSRWGIAQGITRVSQRGQHADDRFEMDRAAARVLETSF